MSSVNLASESHPAADGWAARFDYEDGRLLASERPLQRSRLSVFFGGHIANAAELAATLGRPDVRDARELAYSAWERWGCNLPRHVLGAFALAVVDHRDATVTLVQDALGQCPLFYARVGAACYVADTLAGLVGAVGRRPLCLDYFAAWLRFGYGASDLTPYEGLLRLVHGGYVRLHAGRTDRGHAVVPASGTLPWSHTRADAEHALVAQVGQAVARTCAGLRRPLFELSGGLDSSTVVALASRMGAGAGRLAAVTWGSAHDEDAAHAAILATELGLEHRIVTRPDGDLVDWDGIHRWSEPGNELSGTLRGVLGGLVAGRHDAIVTGVGGDDVFHARGLQPDWLADLLRAGRFGEACRIARAAPADGSPRRLFASQLWRFGVRPLFARAAAAAGEFTPQYRYGPDFLRRCAALAPVDLNLPDDPSVARRRYWKNLRALVANRVAVGHLMPEVRFRHPLLSLPLVEFAASVLGRFETQLRPDRTLQRSAFAGQVPQQILRRTSKGGSLAPEAAYWRSAEARRRFAADEARVVGLGLVDAGQWQGLVGGAGFGRVASLREFDLLVKTEIWLRGQERAAAVPPALALAPCDSD
ncbi:asparagine synthetase B family protein [uncultured Massilia sp.]|uniref:asparagine synthase-related protein n=1 Tax=uncultured Massilia sp. TaxID=169973 RepID=UPI0025F08824|nr:asparagine synthetase B family protein [uncultured Massilia sp.]